VLDVPPEPAPDEPPVLLPLAPPVPLPPVPLPPVPLPPLPATLPPAPPEPPLGFELGLLSPEEQPDVMVHTARTVPIDSDKVLMRFIFSPWFSLKADNATIAHDVTRDRV